MSSIPAFKVESAGLYHTLSKSFIFGTFLEPLRSADKTDLMFVIYVHLRFLRDLRATKKPADHADHADFGVFSVFPPS
jgi:hypothetical protein